MKDFVSIQDQIEQYGLIPFFESQLRDFFSEVDDEDRLQRELAVLKLFKKLYSQIKASKEDPVTISWGDISGGTEVERDIYNLLEGIIIQNGRIRLFKNQVEELFFSVLGLLGLPLDSKDQRETLEKATKDLEGTSQALSDLQSKLTKIKDHYQALVLERKNLSLQIALDRRSEPGINRLEIIDKLLVLIDEVRGTLEQDFSIQESKAQNLKRRVTLLREALGNA